MPYFFGINMTNIPAILMLARPGKTERNRLEAKMCHGFLAFPMESCKAFFSISSLCFWPQLPSGTVGRSLNLQQFLLSCASDRRYRMDFVLLHPKKGFSKKNISFSKSNVILCDVFPQQVPAISNLRKAIINQQFLSQQFIICLYPMTDPWCCYIWWHGSHQYTPVMLAYIPAPWILWVWLYDLWSILMVNKH